MTGEPISSVLQDANRVQIAVKQNISEK